MIFLTLPNISGVPEEQQLAAGAGNPITVARNEKEIRTRTRGRAQSRARSHPPSTWERLAGRGDAGGSKNRPRDWKQELTRLLGKFPAGFSLLEL